MYAVPACPVGLVQTIPLHFVLISSHFRIEQLLERAVEGRLAVQPSCLDMVPKVALVALHRWIVGCWLGWLCWLRWLRTAPPSINSKASHTHFLEGSNLRWLLECRGWEDVEKPSDLPGPRRMRKVYIPLFIAFHLPSPNGRGATAA